MNIVFCFWLHSQVWYVYSHLFSLLGQGLYDYGRLFSLLSQVWYEYSNLFCITLFFFAAEADMNIALVLLLLGQVRKRAQHTLQQCFTYFHYTYHKFIPPLVRHLKNPQVEEHTFKVRICCWVQGSGYLCFNQHQAARTHPCTNLHLAVGNVIEITALWLPECLDF